MIKAARIVQSIALNHFRYNRLDSRRSSTFGECLQGRRDTVFRLCPPQLDADGPAVRFTRGGQDAVGARAACTTHSQTMQHLPDVRFCRMGIVHVVMCENQHAAQAEEVVLPPGNGSGTWWTCCSGCRWRYSAGRSPSSRLRRAGTQLLAEFTRLADRFIDAASLSK